MPRVEIKNVVVQREYTLTLSEDEALYLYEALRSTAPTANAPFSSDEVWHALRDAMRENEGEDFYDRVRTAEGWVKPLFD